MSTRARAQINRENARLSTGPKTEAGKKRSSQNAFRHGIYSKQILLPHEDAEEFEQLRVALLDEHRPATPTEHILVDQLLQSAWRIRRYRELEDAGFEPDNLNAWLSGGLFTVLQRALAAAERAFHRALSALAKLKHERQEHSPAQASSVVETERGSVSDPSMAVSGFVPENSIAQPPDAAKTAQPPSRMA